MLESTDRQWEWREQKEWCELFRKCSHLTELIARYSRWMQQRNRWLAYKMFHNVLKHSFSFGLLKEVHFWSSNHPAESRIQCHDVLISLSLSFHALNVFPPFCVHFRFQIRAARTQPLTQKFSRRRTPTRSCRAGQPRPKCNARASPQITAFLIAVSPDQVSLWVAGRGNKWGVIEISWTALGRV